MEKIHAGTSNNLNLNNDYASNNEEVQRRATPLKRGSAKSVATSEQDLQQIETSLDTKTASNIMSLTLVNNVKK